MGSPTRTRIVRRKPSQLVPLIAIGTIGTPASEREERRALGERQELALAAVDAALAEDHDDPAVGEHVLDAPGRLEQVGLLGAVRDRRSRPTR